MLQKYTKETVTIAFYTLYLLAAAACYEWLPGDADTPNMGVLLFFLLIPIALVYAVVQAIRHLNSNVSYIKCFLIHITVWVSLTLFLTNLKK